MIATIKAHEIYNDEKQTIVNRPRKIKTEETEARAKRLEEIENEEIDFACEKDEDGNTTYLKLNVPTQSDEYKKLKKEDPAAAEQAKIKQMLKFREES